MASKESSVRELFDLSGRVVLLTGASGYLGSAMSRGLAEAGATIVAGSRDIGRAEAAVKALSNHAGGRHFAVSLDHMDEPSLRSGYEQAVALAGPIDVLVNNGTESPACDWKNVDFEQFNRYLANATGYFQLSRLVRDDAVRREAAANIVMIGSMYGVVGSYPEAYDGICNASPVGYHALKGGVIHMTRHLAVYWAQDRVRVNCLSPGAFPNPEKVPDGLVERLLPHCPMQRMGINHELKGVIVFLASEASSYMTGQNLVIDGGWTAW